MFRCVPFENKDKVEKKISKLKSVKSQSIRAPGNWNPYFQTMGAKNNQRVHNNFREFFDKPLGYDQQGYEKGQPKPMAVYKRLSPNGRKNMMKKLDENRKDQKNLMRLT